MKTPIPDWLLKEVAEYDLDIVPPPATILDLGANIGAFCLHYAAKWPAAKITAYEPVMENCQLLIGNLNEIFKVGRIDIYADAVRAVGGEQEIYKGDNFVTHSFHQRGRQTSEKIHVHVTAAGTIPSHELVKIDTEGCEVEILENLDLSCTRAVVVEYHSVKDRAMISAILVEAGFTFLERIEGSAEHGVLKFAKDPGVTLPVAQPAVKAAPAKRKIFLAVAGHYANNDVSFVQSLVALVLRTRVSVQIGWSCDPSVERARNILTANFLETDCTHILFVDADIGFSTEDVYRVSSHAEPIVGGMYPLKNLKPVVEWCGNGLDGAAARTDGLSQVKYIGTGFLCIRREVFETLIARGVAEKYKQDFPPHREEFAFWTQGVRDGRFLTEDWMFCQRCLELGIPVFADTAVLLKHAGRAEWPLPLQAGNPFTQRVDGESTTAPLPMA